MLTACFDESYDAGTFAIGGLVLTNEKRDRFIPEWSAALRDAGVPVFHMSKYESRLGDFAAWDNSKRLAVIDRLTSLIVQHISFGFGVSIDMRHYQAVVPPEGTRFIGGPYRFCFQLCLQRMMKLLPRGVSPVDCVFDQNNAEGGRALLTFPEIKRVWDQNGTLGNIAFGSRAEFVPLQAADIIAYETFKMVKNLSEGGPRDTRRLCARLYEESLQFGVSHYDRDNLSVLVRAFVANGHIPSPDPARS